VDIDIGLAVLQRRMNTVLACVGLFFYNAPRGLIDMKRLTMIKILLMTIALAGSGIAFGGAHEGGGAKAGGDGHCNYVQENMFAGPFKVCQMPTDQAACEELGSTDDNRDAAQGDGACGTDGEVGTCDLGDSKLVYYEGDPGGLEIGCGFQGGEWVSP
jgi:hypothetical protein